ncbi:MAG TPA: hypothetical protein VHE57_15325 [Mycobacteriales bacterium]|nr:hypothetical protein [Mycobacteriales bacterium]
MPVRFGVRVVVVAVGLTLLGAVPARSASPQPHRNIQPSPNFMNVCAEQGAMSDACVADSVSAIDAARRRERMRRYPLLLPRNYLSLNAARKAFVILNLERVDRGLRPIAGMVGPLNRRARVAAAYGADPHPSLRRLQRMGVRVYRTLYAIDYGMLAADYEWMYNDGYATSGTGVTTNAACPRDGAQGCWAHRAAILEPFAGLRHLFCGIGVVDGPGGSRRVAVTLVAGHGWAPRYTFTWRQALSHGANGHRTG